VVFLYTLALYLFLLAFIKKNIWNMLVRHIFHHEWAWFYLKCNWNMLSFLLLSLLEIYCFEFVSFYLITKSHLFDNWSM
jgi:hypothetical protein